MRSTALVRVSGPAWQPTDTRNSTSTWLISCMYIHMAAFAMLLHVEGRAQGGLHWAASTLCNCRRVTPGVCLGEMIGALGAVSERQSVHAATCAAVDVLGVRGRSHTHVCRAAKPCWTTSSACLTSAWLPGHAHRHLHQCSSVSRVQQSGKQSHQRTPRILWRSASLHDHPNALWIARAGLEA